MLSNCCLVLLFNLFFALAINDKSFPKTFIKHRLYSVSVGDNSSLVDEFSSLREEIEIDFWNEPVKGNDKLNFRVDPRFQHRMDQFLEQNKLKYHIVTEDLQKWIEREREENDMNLRNAYAPGRFNFNEFRLDYYHTYDEV